MPVVIGLLRGVNVGGNCKIAMSHLRSICDSLGMENAVTYIQSGNVVFRTKKRDLVKVASDLEKTIEAECGFRPAVVLRTTEQMAGVIKANPFAQRNDLNPSRLLVTFLASALDQETQKRVRAIDVSPEELYPIGAELYTYYLNGIGQSKLPFKALEKAVGCAGTARNWNTVMKLMEMAEKL